MQKASAERRERAFRAPRRVAVVVEFERLIGGDAVALRLWKAVALGAGRLMLQENTALFYS